ncbi:MAG: hypothetical protein V4447_10475 [Pseudomonadota bacterium]
MRFQYTTLKQIKHRFAGKTRWPRRLTVKNLVAIETAIRGIMVFGLHFGASAITMAENNLQRIEAANAREIQRAILTARAGPDLRHLGPAGFHRLCASGHG